MFAVTLAHLVYGIVGVALLILVLFIIDYLRNRPFVSHQEQEVKNLLYDFFNVRWYTDEERIMHFKWFLIFLLIVSLLYGILFKIPIPFIGKPLFMLQPI